MLYRKIIFISVMFLFVPVIVGAHERQMFDINGTHYTFTVGNLNEPVSVDDKSGVDFRVEKSTGAMTASTEKDTSTSMSGMSGMSHAGGPATPVSNLESSLKVELISGGTSRLQEFKATWNVPGAYESKFYPTVAGLYTYRIFGTLDGVAIDLPFTCDLNGHNPSAAPDNSIVEISPNVKRVMKTGAFGCPTPKEELGFPEPSIASADVAKQLRAQGDKFKKVEQNFFLFEILFALVGAGLGVVGLRRGK